ncbi:MAG: hypothetical protein ACR2QU_09110 [Gammaproteobacteria bacterium]
MLNRLQKLSRDMNEIAMAAENETLAKSKRARASLQYVDWDSNRDSARHTPAAPRTRR